MEKIVEQIKIDKHSEYKDSGTEWLGVMPAHWELISNKYIFNLKKNQVGKKSGDYVLLSLTLNGVIKRDMENPQGKFPAEFDTYQEVKKGDFIFCFFDVEETPRAVGLSEFDGMITGAYTVMEPNTDFDRKFLYYFYLNLDGDKRLRSLYKGLRNTIPKESFFSFKTFVPPLKEQSAIASFLDRKTAQIDKAISIKEKQIELLKERRQILIHHAVTRGLNPNVKMKDSGVEWIGEIPEHWEVKRLKNICEMLVSNVDKHSKPLELPVKLCNYVDVYKNDFINSGIEFMYATATIDEISRFKIKLNDVIITKDSEDWLDIGVPALVKFEEESLICGYHLAILRPVNNIFGAFLHRSLLSPYIKTQFSVKANGVTRYGISHGAILGTFIIVPPIEEQKEISVFIETGLERITTAVTCKIKEIEKLKEYKATLINSAVTGKIKVTQDA